MQARLDVLGTDNGARFVKHLVSASRVFAGSGLPKATQELVNIRASQINGCGGCLDMHTKDALHAGESAVRVNLVAAWRETTVFTDAERAALELTEHGTRLADGTGIDDDVWAAAAKHYDDDQMMALVAQISLINTFNRLNVLIGQRGGDYRPGQWG